VDYEFQREIILDKSRYNPILLAEISGECCLFDLLIIGSDLTLNSTPDVLLLSRPLMIRTCQIPDGEGAESSDVNLLRA
jgi:hypothetical protein